MQVYDIQINESILAITIALIALYLYGARRVNYWKNLGIKGPRPLPFFGNMLDNLRKPIPHIELERWKKYGRIYGYIEFFRPTITIGEPELIKQIAIKDFHMFPNRLHRLPGEPFCNMLLFLEDDQWKRVRVILNAAFTSSKMKRMFTSMNRISDNTLQKFDELAKNKTEINVREVFGVHTFDTITSCTFGVDINSHKGGNDEVIKNLETFLDFSSWRWIVILLLPGFLQTRLGLQSTPDFILKYFETTMKMVLENRKKNKDESNDILQLMLNAEAETRFVKGEEKGSFQALEAALSKMDDEGAVFKNMNFSEKKLTFTEILAQSVFLMLAGYHTTTVLLSYCSYVLALHPEIDAKLHDELKRKLGSKKDVQYEDISSLMYLDAFVNETLRYYPPVIGYDLVSSTNYKLKNTDITIPKGTRINFPVYALHHDPEFFPEPENFKPERFFPENRDSIIPCSYLPFGTGPRICLGMRFAVLECKVLLARLVLDYRFKRIPRTAVPPVFISKTDMLQFEDIYLGVEKREQ